MKSFIQVSYLGLKFLLLFSKTFFTLLTLYIYLIARKYIAYNQS